MNKILAVAVGGAGGNTLQRFKSHDQFDFLYINSDSDSLKQITDSRKLYISRGELSSPHSTPTDLAARRSDSINNAIADYRIITVIVGLGGNTGSELLKIISDAVKRAEKVISVIAFLPFKFEQARRRRALTIVEESEAFAKRATIIDLETLLTEATESTSPTTLNEVLERAEVLAISKLERIAALTKPEPYIESSELAIEPLPYAPNLRYYSLSLACQLKKIDVNLGMDKMSGDENICKMIRPFFEINLTATADNPFEEFIFNIHLTFDDRATMETEAVRLETFIGNNQMLLMDTDCYSLIEGEITAFNPKFIPAGDEQ